MSTRTEIDFDEETTTPVTLTFTSDGTTPIPLANVNSITMDLIDVVSGDTINSRSSQDVLNTNNCTMHATSGVFTWTVQPEDNIVYSTARTPVGRREQHLATGVLIYDTTKKRPFEIVLNVKNMRGVT